MISHRSGIRLKKPRPNGTREILSHPLHRLLEIGYFSLQLLQSSIDFGDGLANLDERVGYRESRRHCCAYAVEYLHDCCVNEFVELSKSQEIERNYGDTYIIGDKAFSFDLFGTDLEPYFQHCEVSAPKCSIGGVQPETFLRSWPIISQGVCLFRYESTRRWPKPKNGMVEISFRQE